MLIRVIRKRKSGSCMAEKILRESGRSIVQSVCLICIQ